MQVTPESRTALHRAWLFLQLAERSSAEDRVHFEAFVEATIVFARAALHRLQTKNVRHPKWTAWWSSLLANPSVTFFRRQRDWLLKEAPPKIGQKGFVGSAVASPDDFVPTRADDFYFFENPAVSATATLARHLTEVERLLHEAEALFS